MSSLQAKRVEPTELFFDLVFVYAISQTVGLIHHLHHGIVEPIQFIRYIIAMTALVSMWCIHTFYVNRYSDHSVRDTLFLMGNMLLVMMFSNTINVDWGQSYAMSFGTLSLIVFSVIAQNLWRYFESEPGPARTVNLTYASILMINGIGFLVAAFIPTFSSALTVGVAGLVIPWILYPWVGRKAIQQVPINGPHLVERLMLLVIITFGEVVIGTKEYFSITHLNTNLIPAMCIVIALFYHYMKVIDTMINHHGIKTGEWVTYWHIPIQWGLGMVTVSFAFLLDSSADPTFRWSFFYVGIAIFYIAVLAIQKYNLNKVALTTTFIIWEIIIYAVIAGLAWFVKDNSTYLLWTTAVVTGWIAWQTHKRALLIEKHH